MLNVIQGFFLSFILGSTVFLRAYLSSIFLKVSRNIFKKSFVLHKFNFKISFQLVDFRLVSKFFYKFFCNLEKVSSLSVTQVNCCFSTTEIMHKGLKLLLLYLLKNSLLQFCLRRYCQLTFVNEESIQKVRKYMAKENLNVIYLRIFGSLCCYYIAERLD